VLSKTTTERLGFLSRPHKELKVFSTICNPTIDVKTPHATWPKQVMIVVGGKTAQTLVTWRSLSPGGAATYLLRAMKRPAGFPERRF
jgi:hypothetical protein